MPLDNLQPGQTSKQFATIQEKNLQHLIKILGTKESIEALTEISKIEKSTWKDIKESIKSLADFALGGSISAIKAEIGTIVKENVDGALGPLYNELQPIINEVMRAIEPLMPYVVELVKWATDILVPIIKWIADILQEIINYFTGFGQDELVLFDGEWILRSQLPPGAVRVGDVEYRSPTERRGSDVGTGGGRTLEGRQGFV